MGPCPATPGHSHLSNQTAAVRRVLEQLRLMPCSSSLSPSTDHSCVRESPSQALSENPACGWCGPPLTGKAQTHTLGIPSVPRDLSHLASAPPKAMFPIHLTPLSRNKFLFFASSVARIGRNLFQSSKMPRDVVIGIALFGVMKSFGNNT